MDYDELCKLDVLGLGDTLQYDQGEVYREFREQLSRSEMGWYEVALPWKGNHPYLLNDVDQEQIEKASAPNWDGLFFLQERRLIPNTCSLLKLVKWIMTNCASH